MAISLIPRAILEISRRLHIDKKIPDKTFVSLQYQGKMKEKLDLSNPKAFNAKLQWIKLFDRNPEYTMMVDKALAKEYVANKLSEEYIVPTYGVWDSFDEIDFDNLPNKFVLKCTHDSGGLVICRDKSALDMEEARKKIEHCLTQEYFYNNREWPYKDVKPRILAEEYLDMPDGIIDYKFYCFNGEPKYLYISQGLEDHSTARISFLTMDFERAPFNRSDYKPFENIPQKPVNFEKMKEIARELSKNIPFVRVDLYEVDKKIYFSELTFTPCAGHMPFSPKEYDYKLGEELVLPIEKKTT